jgi:hypothetical protein
MKEGKGEEYKRKKHNYLVNIKNQQSKENTTKQRYNTRQSTQNDQHNEDAEQKTNKFTTNAKYEKAQT